MNTIHDCYYVYVGTYGDEDDEAIQMLEFNSSNGRLRKLASATGIENPSFLTVNQAQTELYAVSEVEKGQVVNFKIDLSALTMTEANRQSTWGNGPCYLTLDSNEKQLFTVNYGEGVMVGHSIEQDGTIGSITDINSYRGEHQSHPHAIMAIPGTTKYIVTDLGLNKLYLYEYNESTSKLVLIKEIDTVVASGPRHMAVDPERRKLYIINEFNSMISVYSYDRNAEQIELVQEIATIPAGYAEKNYGADIHFDQEKSLLYASNRGHHSLASYHILEDGLLELIDYAPVEGEWPRNFAIVPGSDYILVANEHTDSIVVMKSDEYGLPHATGAEFEIKAPVCLKVMPVN